MNTPKRGTYRFFDNCKDACPQDCLNCYLLDMKKYNDHVKDNNLVPQIDFTELPDKDYWQFNKGVMVWVE